MKTSTFWEICLDWNTCFEIKDTKQNKFEKGVKSDLELAKQPDYNDQAFIFEYFTLEA